MKQLQAYFRTIRLPDDKEAEILAQIRNREPGYEACVAVLAEALGVAAGDVVAMICNQQNGVRGLQTLRNRV